MGHQITVTLMRDVRDSIERLTAAGGEQADQRGVLRALAHLWSAYDELEMLTHASPPARPAHGLRVK